MKKTLLGMLGAGLTLMLVAQGCGGSDPAPPPPPLADGGTWVECDEQDAGVCGVGQSCRFVEAYERSLCVDSCEPATGCADPSLACCPHGEDGGTGGFCLPQDACTPPDAGASDGGTSDGGPGTSPDGGPGPVEEPDAGPGTDGGKEEDAGLPDSGTDGGSAPDAGLPDAGTDGGSAPDAGPPDSGTDAGSPDSGIDAGTPDSGTDAGTPDAGTARIRLMAANISSGNYQAYEAPGIRLMQGAQPDIVMIQEFNYKSGSISDLVNTTFGPGFYYYQEAGAQIPNGIISRYPIIASGEWKDPEVDNRDFAWARIDIPGPKDLWVVSVHLLTRNATTRNTEAVSIVEKIKANVPAGDYLAIGGDFNTDSRSESCFNTFKQVVDIDGPHPADKNGNSNTNASRGKPYDHVLVDADLRAYQTATVIGASSFASGLVLDSRVYTPLSEIAPVQQSDSAASNMQHMGVIKDFLVPLGGDTGTPDAGTDAGTPDSGIDGGPAPDAGPAEDAGTPDSGIDAGPAQDAGPAEDAGTPDSGIDAGPAQDAGTPDAGTARIRLMAANISSGNYQAYEAPGIRLMQGVNPDIVMIQEFNYKSGSISDLVNTTFGPGFYYYQEAGAQIPNGIISRYPIIASGEWKDPEVDNRDFAWARIDIPGPKDLWVVSVHLLTRNATTRNTEAVSIVEKIKANVPAGDYLAVGGDFNTDSRSESCFSTFKQVVVTDGPHPVDKNGKDGTNAGRSKPYDHVLVDADLRAYQTATVLGASSFANGLVLDSRVYTPLSEIAPVQQSDSAASNMQHMGVIKDFLVPLN
ncbi:endonuclease/exonuclease/phosphatase family protein [Stigmatella hybrida]|uniref:endonuclease/exonuclease/phosphatase family protein n=1 Tax=Stigmatella hybrida TaxID=394097 RepID=UPI001CDA73C2|nr:endonuclease/exonuclease/phosphatase family protein [Stigmatella hybrida]